MRVTRPIGIALTALAIQPAPAPINTDEKIAAALTISDLLQRDDWLPFLKPKSQRAC